MTGPGQQRMRRRVAWALLVCASSYALWLAWSDAEAVRQHRERSAAREKTARVPARSSAETEVVTGLSPAVTQAMVDHPELRREVRHVPDSQNGLLHLLDFRRRFPENGNFDEVPYVYDQEWASSAHWDPEKYAAWRSQHLAELEELKGIVLLPGTSCNGIDRAQFRGWNTFESKVLGTLGAEFRYQAEQGDAAARLQAFNALAGVYRIMGGYEAAEMPQNIMGAGDNEQAGLANASRLAFAQGDWQAGDLRAWREVLPAMDNEGLATALRRNWQMVWGYPEEQRDSGDREMAEREVGEFAVPHEFFLKSETLLAVGMIQQARTMTLGELRSDQYQMPDNGWMDEAAGPTRGLLHQTRWLFESWANLDGSLEQVRAAVAIALGEAPPVEPVTGLPFVIDRDAGTVALPEDPRLSLKLPPLKIPQLAGRR